MGETTFGKGLIQTIVELSDGSGVAVTVARYQTPAGMAASGQQLISPHCQKAIHVVPTLHKQPTKNIADLLEDGTAVCRTQLLAHLSLTLRWLWFL